MNRNKLMTLTPSRIFYLIVIFVLTLFSSCNKSYQRVTYLNAENDLYDTLYQKNKPLYHLQTGDVLYIQIKSPNKETDALFNKMAGNSMNLQSATTNGHLFGYPISDSGYIELPVVGSVYLLGKTIEESKDIVYQGISKYVKAFDLELKLFSIDFVIMGEVGNPGAYKVPAEEVNIFEALAQAGEITYYGKREEVLVVRQNQKGTSTFKVDLTKDNVMASEGYYVMPNDVIYVKPMKITAFRARSGDVLTVLGFMTSTLTAILLVMSLGNN